MIICNSRKVINDMKIKKQYNFISETFWNVIIINSLLFLLWGSMLDMGIVSRPAGLLCLVMMVMAITKRLALSYNRTQLMIGLIDQFMWQMASLLLLPLFLFLFNWGQKIRWGNLIN